MMSSTRPVASERIVPGGKPLDLDPSDGWGEEDCEVGRHGNDHNREMEKSGVNALSSLDSLYYPNGDRTSKS